MKDTFIYFGYSIEDLNGKKYICVKVVDDEKFSNFRIFKPYDKDLELELQEKFDKFDDISSSMSFVVRRDLKTNKPYVALDIDI